MVEMVGDGGGGGGDGGVGDGVGCVISVGRYLWGWLVDWQSTVIGSDPGRTHGQYSRCSQQYMCVLTRHGPGA